MVCLYNDTDGTALKCDCQIQVTELTKSCVMCRRLTGDTIDRNIPVIILFVLAWYVRIKCYTVKCAF